MGRIPGLQAWAGEKLVCPQMKVVPTDPPAPGDDRSGHSARTSSCRWKASPRPESRGNCHRSLRWQSQCDWCLQGWCAESQGCSCQPPSPGGLSGAWGRGCLNLCQGLRALSLTERRGGFILGQKNGTRSSQLSSGWQNIQRYQDGPLNAS